MPTMEQHADKLRTAIHRAAQEHGVPNSFGFVELHTHYGAPAPMIAGKALRMLSIPGVEHFMNGILVASTYNVTPPL